MDVKLTVPYLAVFPSFGRHKRVQYFRQRKPLLLPPDNLAYVVMARSAAAARD